MIDTFLRTSFAHKGTTRYGEVSSNSMKGRRREKTAAPPATAGFTLLEVLVAVAIVGILIGLAVPGMTGFLNNHRLETAARTVWSDVQSAKMAAIKENQSVILQRTSPTQYSYSFVDGFGNVHSFVRNLADECPSVTITLTGTTPIRFVGSGIRQPGENTTVTLANSAGTRNFLVAWSGSIGGVTTP